MTKKDYQQFATLIGAFQRNQPENPFPPMFIEELTWLFLDDNPHFDSVKFHQWIDEVTTGKRDLSGNRITKQKEAQSV